MQAHQLLTIDEFCDYTGLNRQQAAQLRYLGTGPRFVKVTGRTVRYRWSDVEAWIEERSKQRTDDRPGVA